MVAKAASTNQNGITHSIVDAVGPGLVRLLVPGDIGLGVGEDQDHPRGPGQTGEPPGGLRHAGSVVACQYCEVWAAPSKTTNSRPWVCPADGARRAAASSWSTTPESSGVALKFLVMCRLATASVNSTVAP